MDSTVELSEEKVFHVLRQGQSEPTGPYTQVELETLLSQEEVQSSDFVYFPDLSEWTPLADVFELRQGADIYSDDGQDPEIVKASFATTLESCEPEEDILYIAVQQPAPKDRISEILQEMPISVVLTNRRICIVASKLIGDLDVETIKIPQIACITNQPNRRTNGGDLKIELTSGETKIIDSIPENQRSRFIELAEEVFQSGGAPVG